MTNKISFINNKLTKTGNKNRNLIIFSINYNIRMNVVLSLLCKNDLKKRNIYITYFYCQNVSKSYLKLLTLKYINIICVASRISCGVSIRTVSHSNMIEKKNKIKKV